MARRRNRTPVQVIEEEWRAILEFPNFSVSNLGRIYNNETETFLSGSPNNYGHLRVAFPTEEFEAQYDSDGRFLKMRRVRATRSLAVLVAQAFVEAPSVICDHVILLDGNLSNVVAHNLAWRPSRFAWLYTHQLKELDSQPFYFKNLEVTNLQRNIAYESIVEAGMMEGLLFEDIWTSTYAGTRVFPYGHVFEVTEQV